MTLKCDVEFGGVSLGDQTARIGVSCDKDAIDPFTAEQHLCGRRVRATIELARSGEADQKRFKGMEPERIETVCDVKSYRSAMKSWSWGLTFQLESVATGSLGHFAKRSGRIEIDVLGDADHKEVDPKADHRTGPTPPPAADATPAPAKRSRKKAVAK